MADIVIWGQSLQRTWLSDFEFEYLSSLPEALPDVAWVWREMDRVWKDMGLDNQCSLEGQDVRRYYRHPVWLMNGIFTARDPVSAGHRNAVANYFKAGRARVIADYGGGFGELAKAIVRNVPDAVVAIVEPFPSEVGLRLIGQNSKLCFVPDLLSQNYDAVIAQDVLEHVEDPVGLAYEIASRVQVGGELIFANCFYPVIQCHIPSTFHLRHTFPWVMRGLGLRYVGKIDGAEHAQVFRRVGALNLGVARQGERISKLFHPAFGRCYEFLSRIKRLLV